jgi:hypothetical protein
MFFILFCFSFIQSIFKIIFKSSLNHFKFWLNPLSTIKSMHQHECTTTLLFSMMNFNLMKNIISPMFHEHEKSKLNHFSYISKDAIFRV